MTEKRASPNVVSTKRLKAATRTFFKRHWSISAAVPEWVRLDPADVAESANQGGCYAVLNAKGDVIYVGLGIARAQKAGAPSGILRRLYRHVLVRGDLTKGRLSPKREPWEA